MIETIRKGGRAAGSLRVRAVLGAFLMLSLSACPSTPIALPTIRKVHPTGRILAFVAGSNPRLLEFSVSSSRWRSVPLPATPLSGFFWGEPPSDYAFVSDVEGASRLVRVTEDGLVRPLLSSLPVEFPSGTRPVDGLVVAARCQGAQSVFILDLNRATAPRRVTQGCPAALSPDGRSVAYSPDPLSVWRSNVESGASAALVLRLAGALERSLGMRQPRIFAQAGMSWGTDGLAVAVQGEGRFACLVAAVSGRVGVIHLGSARPTDLRWDPTGRLLAFIEHDRTGGAIRVYDNGSGRFRLAAFALGRHLQGLVWSPDGRALVTLEGTDRWLVVTPGGGTVRSVDVPAGAIPSDWAS